MLASCSRISIPLRKKRSETITANTEATPMLRNSSFRPRPEMLSKRPKDVEGFLRALIKAEKFIKANPTESQMIYSKATSGRVSPEMAKARWSEADYAIELNKGLVDLLVAEAEWVVAKGAVKGEPTATTIQKFLATAPLKAIDPSRVTID